MPRPERYPEIAEDICKKIEAGKWEHQLPTTRDLVWHYRCSSRTILKVWDKLKADGIITTRPGKGSYVKKRS